MQWIRGNIGVDGSEFLKGFLGLDWLPSDEAKANMKRFETTVVQLVNEVTKPASGFWIVQEINGASSKKVMIKPWIPQEDADELNKNSGLPYGTPDSYAKATPAGDYAKTTEKPAKGDNLGVGGGTDYVIRYTPWWYQGKSARKGPAFGADELMCHELIHAMNAIKGIMVLTSGAPPDFDGLEEFGAILMTNIYSGQLRRQLRKDHDGHQILPPPLDTSQGFYTRFGYYVEQVAKLHPQLAGVYKHWGSDTNFLPFNPFAFCK